MSGQKFGQVGLRRQQQHGKVAPVHDMTLQSARLFDQPTEVGIKLRCASSDIERWNVGLCQGLKAELRRYARHAFRPVRTRIDVAMPADLIAELSNVDLKDSNAGRPKWMETGPVHRHLKCRAGPGGLQDMELLSG